MATHGFLETPAKRKKIIALVLAGKSHAEVALAVSTRRESVSRQAIFDFCKRHADVIVPAEAEMIAEVKRRWIADKDERLVRLEAIYAGLDQVREDYGFMVTTEEASGKDGERVIYDQHFNGALAAQMRGVLSDASDELGQKPKPDMHIGDKYTFVFEVIAPNGGNEYPQLG